MALSLGQKAGWGLADLGVVVFVVVKQLLILTYLTTVLGVPVGIAGLVTTGVLIFDMMTTRLSAICLTAPKAVMAVAPLGWPFVLLFCPSVWSAFLLRLRV